MKRVFAFLLALAMVLSLSVTAFAEEEKKGSITITNATEDETYSIYHIFDASIKYKTNSDGTLVLENGKPVVDGVAYTIDPEKNQFFAVLFEKVTADDGTITYRNTAGNTFFDYNPNSSSVTKKEGVNDSELTMYLTDLVTNIGEKDKYNYTFTTAVAPVVANSDEVKFNNLPYGYYLITSSLGATVTINSNTPDVEVIDKNQEPGTDFDKQVQTGVDGNGDPIWEDANSANIGDKITYKISFEATNYDGDKQIKHYQIHDEKGDAIWAEFNSIQVWVDGKELPRGYYLSQGGDRDNGTWEWLGDYDNTCSDGWDDVAAEQKVRDNAQWYLVHLGYDQFRVTIPWLEGHALEDVTTNGTVTSYSLTYPVNATSKYDSPAEVIITYDAVVEPEASIGGTTHGNRFNKANASWTSEYETGSTPPDEVVTKVYGLGLLKDDSATGQNLADAKFRIYKDAACTDPVWVIPTNIDGVYMVDSKGTYAEGVSGTMMKDAREYYLEKPGYQAKLDAYLQNVDYRKNADGEYLLDKNGEQYKQDNLVISQVNGKLIILGLEAGSYYLKEIEAPDGYNALTDPVELKAGEGTRSFNIFVNETTGSVKDLQQTDGVHTEKIYDLTHTVVHNSKGAQLPSTGGEGTIMLITIGTLVAIGFAVLMITQKKMSIYKG